MANGTIHNRQPVVMPIDSLKETTTQEMKQHIELKEVATGSYWLRIGVNIPLKLIKH